MPCKFSVKPPRTCPDALKRMCKIDIFIAAEIIRNKKSLNEILASNTGQSLKKIEKDTDRDYIMTPQEALEYGMIDKVITKE